MTESSDIPDLVAEALGILEEEGEAAYEAFLARHPGFTVVVRERVASLRGAGLVEPNAAAEVPEVLGEYKLLDKIGSGGMGMVYLAEQTSLRRQVAIKVVRPELLYFPGSKERFRREVEAIARLQHPGLISIYGVGEERGLPYYAMELVRGIGLNDLIERMRHRAARSVDGTAVFDLVRSQADSDSDPGDAAPSFFAGGWTAFCCRTVQQVAEALQHAHQSGVLHRDVKPSNIMVTGSGRVVLLDFGLAAAEGSDDLTRTGAQLGSLPYMAPEQVEGRSADIGPRTDVYGLGVTLYELLGRRPAFCQATQSDLRQRIVHGEKPPLRDSWIDRDAALVCQKAMDQDPEQRYATPAELAEDLARVLAGEPIHARAPSPWLRLRRFVRRRPVLSTLAAVLLATAVIGPLVYLQVEARQREEVARRRQALTESVAAVQRLTQSFDDMEGLSELQRDRLEESHLKEALHSYERLSATADQDQRLPLERARTFDRLGRLLRKLSRAQEARQALEQAQALFQTHLDERRAQESEPERGVVIEIQSSALQLAWAQRDTVQVREAVATAERALQQLLSLQPLDVEEVAEEAALRRFLGVHYLQLGKLKDAESHVAQALFHMHAFSKAVGQDSPYAYWHEYASAAQLLGVIYLETEDPQRVKNAENLFKQALKLQGIICRLFPGVHSARIALGFRHRGLGFYYLELGKPELAIEEFRAAIAVRDELIGQDLNRPRIGISRCDDQGLLARALWARGDRQEAREELADAAAAARNIGDAHPDNLEFQEVEARLLSLSGEFALKDGDQERARAWLRTAYQKHGKIRRSGELDPESVRSQARTEIMLGLAELSCGADERAGAHLNAGFKRLRGVKAPDQQRLVREELRELTLQWAYVLCRCRDLQAALGVLRMGITNGELGPQDLSGQPALAPLESLEEFRRMRDG